MKVVIPVTILDIFQLCHNHEFNLVTSLLTLFLLLGGKLVPEFGLRNDDLRFGPCCISHLGSNRLLHV